MSEKKSGLVACSVCGQLVDDGDAYENVDGSHVCDECFSSGRAVLCDRCGDRVPADDVRLVLVSRSRYEHWCSSCVDDDAERCDVCGALYHDRTGGAVETLEGDVIHRCPACDWYGEIPSTHVSCSECGAVLLGENAMYSDRLGEWFCEECYPEDDDEYLDAYGHTYADRFFGDSGCGAFSDGLYLGVELETVAGRDHLPGCLARDVIEATTSGLFACKTDSSLGDDGCEIVSQPATPLYHIKSGEWERVADACAARGATSHDSGVAGLHVHISKDFFTRHDKDEGAALYVLNQLVQLHPAEWLRFSRRTMDQINEWARFDRYDGSSFDECYPLDSDPISTKIDKYRAAKSSTRYLAVNDQTGRATVELRFFRGTLNVTTLYATIEAAAGLALVAAKCACDVSRAERMTWSDLKSAICDELHGSHIPNKHFVDYCVSRGL